MFKIIIMSIIFMLLSIRCLVNDTAFRSIMGGLGGWPKEHSDPFIILEVKRSILPAQPGRFMGKRNINGQIEIGSRIFDKLARDIDIVYMDYPFTIKCYNYNYLLSNIKNDKSGIFFVLIKDSQKINEAIETINKTSNIRLIKTLECYCQKNEK